MFETMEFAYQEILSGPAMLPHHYRVLIYSVIERVLFCGRDLEQKSEIRNYVKKTAQPLVLEDASGLCVAKVEIRGRRTEGISPRSFARRQT
jgi:hypothetical protein